MDHVPEILEQKVSAFPDLLTGESIIFETGQGIPPLAIAAAIILTVMPPFILGVLALALVWWIFKDGRVVLTNVRLLIFRKTAFGGYLLDSIPLIRIKHVSRMSMDFMHLLSRLSKIQVFGVDSLLPKAAPD